MKKSLFTICLSLVCIFCTQATNEPKFDHSPWTNLLQRYVSADGVVNYDSFKADRESLNNYLEALSKNVPDKSWPKNDAMAYWINAYNAFTVSLIIENYPLKSIMNLHDGRAWARKFIKLGGEEYSLNNIEHDILRKKYKDERIHFAVNCASVSCPKLFNKAFVAEGLDEQLENAAREFINNEEKNSVTPRKIEISKLFDWYKDDFLEYGGIHGYINHYSKQKTATEAKVTYKTYDWSLNNK